MFSNCIITGDKGYINKTQEINLFETAAIQLEIRLRSNQKDKEPVLPILKKVRKRIETVFSQLCDQFLIQRNLRQLLYRVKMQNISQGYRIDSFAILRQIHLSKISQQS